MGGFTKTFRALKWEMPNLELDANGKFAVNSMTLNLSAGTTPDKSIIVSCSLVERDSFNTDGIVLCFPSKSEFVFKTATLEFWKLDSSRPRNIIFTLDGLNVVDINFVSIVLAFE